MSDTPQPGHQMTDEELDAVLAACAAEPIHIPGSIQPHGVLLAVDERTLRIERASANCATLLDRDPGSLLGTEIADLLPELGGDVLRSPDLAELSPLPTVGPLGPVEASLHRSGGFVVVELEATSTTGAGATVLRRLRGALDRIHDAPDLDTLLATVATEVRALTGFDRVLVYRFDEDWNGIVVAEDLADGLDPFLGLRFPASDIPAQARALYTTNWLRLIADRDYTPVPIVPEPTDTAGQPLDLSGSTLRSVSPVHLEYLRNMGVVASMSISLLERGTLWGLISCHHQTAPLRPSPSVRAAAEFLGRTVSALLPATSAAGTHERVLAIRDAETELVQQITAPDIDAATAVATETLLDMTAATGAAIRLEDQLVTIGEVPSAEALDAIAASLLAGGATTAATHSLVQHDPALAAWSDQVAGAAVTRVGTDADQWILCLRPEVARTVTWGGSPEEKLVVDGRLGPRTSFAAWTEEVRDTSDPWAPEELAALERVGTAVGAALLRRARLRDRLTATLNRALLLEALPDLDGVELCVRYRPAARAEIGGDWYDVFSLPNERVAVVVGDVAGHGLTAMPMMAHLRHGLRAYLLKAAGPAEALTRLNDLIAALLPSAFATAVVAEFDPATGVVRYANAGHLPPLVVTADGPLPFSEERGPALGAAIDTAYRTSTVTLAPGDALFLYTDGVVERRGESIDAGLDRVRASAATDGLAATCDALMELAGHDHDDATVLGLLRPAP